MSDEENIRFHKKFMKETVEDTPEVNVRQIEKYLAGIEQYNKLIRRRLKMLYEQTQEEAKQK